MRNQTPWEHSELAALFRGAQKLASKSEGPALPPAIQRAALRRALFLLHVGYRIRWDRAQKVAQSSALRVLEQWRARTLELLRQAKLRRARALCAVARAEAAPNADYATRMRVERAL